MSSSHMFALRPRDNRGHPGAHLKLTFWGHSKYNWNCDVPYEYAAENGKQLGAR